MSAIWQAHPGWPAAVQIRSQRFTCCESGLSDRLRERPDAQQELGVVLAAKVGLFLEVLVIGELGSQITGKRAEQRPGGLVVFGNRGFQVRDLVARVPAYDFLQHPLEIGRASCRERV